MTPFTDPILEWYITGHSGIFVPENTCRFSSRKVWTFDFKKRRIKAYLLISFTVTGVKASSVMNKPDLWVDSTQALSCLLIGARDFFMPFLVHAPADLQTKPAVFGCFGKKRKGRKNVFHKNQTT